jgi:putative membrane protein
MPHQNCNSTRPASLRAPVWACCALLLCALGIARSESQAIQDSAGFAREAAQSFSAQLTAARLAQTKSQDAAVRDFAASVAAESQRASQALSALCEQLNIDMLPQPEDAKVAAATATRPESSFDNVYTLETSQQLARAEALFDQALRAPKVDPRLKDFARQQKEVIRDLRQRAEPLARRQAGERRQ